MESAHLCQPFHSYLYEVEKNTETTVSRSLNRMCVCVYAIVCYSSDKNVIIRIRNLNSTHIGIVMEEIPNDKKNVVLYQNETFTKLVLHKSLLEYFLVYFESSYICGVVCSAFVFFFIFGDRFVSFSLCYFTFIFSFRLCVICMHSVAVLFGVRMIIICDHSLY